MEPENTPFSEKEMFIYKSPNLGIHWLVFAGVVVLRKQFILMSAHLKLRGLLRPWPMVSIFFACFQTRIWNPDIVNSVYINRWLNLYENIEKIHFIQFHTTYCFTSFHIYLTYYFKLFHIVLVSLYHIQASHSWGRISLCIKNSAILLKSIGNSNWEGLHEFQAFGWTYPSWEGDNQAPTTSKPGPWWLGGP